VGGLAQELETGTAIGEVPSEDTETDSLVPEKLPPPRTKTAAAATPKVVEQQKRTRTPATERALDRDGAKRTTPPGPAPARKPDPSDSAPDTSAMPPASPPSASISLEQQAQVGRRIGLDEAARRLGVPAHAIEGMSPLFLGLALGRFPDGADPATPLIRGVYLDPNGVLILLDQQRIESQPMPAATATRWRTGDVMLYLHGDAQPGVLENLAKRVR
jgi:hypothetical protein